MVSLEQVTLLESRVIRAIEYVTRVDAENAALRQKETELRAKLGTYQKRIDELEVLVMRFKEDQSRIEDGILSALDRLSQFEEAVEKSLNEKQAEGKAAGVKSAVKSTPVKTPVKAEAKESPAPAKPVQEKPAPQPAANAGQQAAPKPAEAGRSSPAPAGAVKSEAPAAGEMFFEIPEADTEEDIADPLAGEDGESSSPDGELDIF